ncbi:MAG: hypothetical protein WC755_00755 [Candidatus Woesearchaeota archaeon]|jgi:hypothetical protein
MNQIEEAGIENYLVIHSLAKKCVEDESVLSNIVQSYEELKPFYKNSTSPGIAVEQNPVPELNYFWNQVSKVTGYNFSYDLRAQLAKDKGAPGVFLGSLSSFAITNFEKYWKRYVSKTNHCEGCNCNILAESLNDLKENNDERFQRYGRILKLTTSQHKK